VESFKPPLELEVVLRLYNSVAGECQKCGNSARVGFGDLGILDCEETLDAGPQLDEAHDGVPVAVGISEPVQSADDGILNLGSRAFAEQSDDPVEETDPTQIGHRLRIQGQILFALPAVAETRLRASLLPAQDGPGRLR